MLRTRLVNSLGCSVIVVTLSIGTSAFAQVNIPEECIDPLTGEILVTPENAELCADLPTSALTYGFAVDFPFDNDSDDNDDDDVVVVIPDDPDDPDGPDGPGDPDGPGGNGGMTISADAGFADGSLTVNTQTGEWSTSFDGVDLGSN